MGPVKLSEDFEAFMELQDSLLNSKRRFISIYDFRDYPFFPPVSLMQQIMPWVVERKPLFDECVVTVVVCLRENMWTSAVKALVYTFARAAPPVFPWTIVTDEAEMENWVNHYAAEHSATCKSKKLPGSPVPSLREAALQAEDRCGDSTTIDGLSSVCSSPRSECSYASACSFFDALSDLDEDHMDYQDACDQDHRTPNGGCASGRDCCGVASDSCAVL
jgi:hypothetical protein